MEKQKFTFYVNENTESSHFKNYIWVSAPGDLTLTKIEIEAETIEEAFQIVSENEKSK